MTKRGLTEEEKKLFKEAMKDVKPLPKKSGSKKIAVKTEQNPLVQKPVKKPATTLPARPLSTKTEAPTSKGGIDKATLKKVKRGEYVIDAKLDLHGMTREQAYIKLTNFIHSSYEKNRRGLLVITGKGGYGEKRGILQQEVPRWLALSPLSPMILVVSSATAKHGGQGALYVVLRRK